MNRKRTIVKKISGGLVVPVIRWYLSKKRNVNVGGLHITVPQGVFHPALYFSSKYLFRFLKQQHLEGTAVLELGAGSGLLSVYAAQKGAAVTASDISAVSCKAVNDNAVRNRVSISVIHSNLFDSIPRQYFHYILINPPYFPAEPKSESDHAWYCGEHFEYFHKLFEQLPSYINGESTVVMILSEDCNLSNIKCIAEMKGLCMKCFEEKRNWFEKNYLFQIEQQPGKIRGKIDYLSKNPTQLFR
ncbi:MAG: methyltransferase [Ferruginibacter sp.]|nr:methyltransferase [Chitinophagaceae bacterium]